MATIHEGAFAITTVVDSDGHLSIYVRATDGSKLVETEEEIGGADEFGARFTTDKIETDYRATQIADQSCGSLVCEIQGALIDYATGKSGLVDFYAGKINRTTGELSIDREDREVALHVTEGVPNCFILTGGSAIRYAVIAEGVAKLTVESLRMVSDGVDGSKPVASAVPGAPTEKVRYFEGTIQTDKIGSACDFSFEVSGSVTESEIESEARDAAFNHIGWSYREVS